MKVRRNPEKNNGEIFELSFQNVTSKLKPQASSFCLRCLSIKLCKNSVTHAFTLCWRVRTYERGGSIKQMENSALPEHANEASFLLCMGVEGQAGKSRCLFSFARPGTDLTPPNARVGPGVRTSNFLCARAPPRLCGRSSHRRWSLAGFRLVVPVSGENMSESVWCPRSQAQKLSEVVVCSKIIRTLTNAIHIYIVI